MFQSVGAAAADLLAEVDLRSVRSEQARARPAPHGAQEEGLALHSILPILPEAHLALGEPEAAIWVETSIQQAQAHGNRVSLIDSLRVRAILTARHGRLVDAKRDLDEALRMVQEIQYPLGEARVRLRYAAVLMQHGAADTARDHRERAENILQSLGARLPEESVASPSGRLITT